MTVKGRLMGKWFVWGWLVAVVLTLVGMQAILFGTKGLPKIWRGPAPAKAQPTAPAKAGQQLVQPESLAQGFIVVVNDKTRKANASSPIFMPSSHNGWN